VADALTPRATTPTGRRPTSPLEPWRTRWRAWAAGHETLLRRLAVARVTALWLSLAYVAAVYVAVPETRPGLRAWLGCYWLLVLWFLLARTKTVSWRAYALLFVVAVPWAGVIAALTVGLTAAAGDVGGVAADGPRTAIAAFGEEALKLAPLAVLAAVAPGRVRRFTGADWLLAGVALGLGFQAFEDLVRRIVVAHEGGAYERLSLLLPQHGPGLDSGFPQYGWSPLAGGSSVPDAGYGGHHVFTGLACAGIGLGVAAWRRSRSRATPQARAGWLAAAVGTPVALWALAVLDHFGFNASLRSMAWVQGDDPTVPWPLRAAWQAAGHGYGRAWLLLALLAALTVLDLRRLAAASRTPGADLLTGLPWTTRHPAGMLARDVAFVATAHAREAGDTLRTALARGRVAAAMVRLARADAWERAPGATPSTALVRRAALVALAGLALAALVVGPWLAHVIGPELTQDGGRFGGGLFGDGTWLAGILDRFAEWWDGRSLGQQIALGAGVAALVVLSGGSLGIGLGVSGALTYLAEHGHGAADLTRDPRRAVRSYLTTTTPAGFALDAAGLALTFAPARVAGLGGSSVRTVVDDYAGDATTWAASRRQNLQLLPGAEGPPPLDVGELAALRYYTGRGYARVNLTLRGGTPMVPEVAGRIDALSSALRKLPDHIGWVHRGADLTPGQLGRYRPGAVIREQPFTSTAVLAEDRFSGNTHFVIRSYSGRDVATYSQVPAEREVLFDRATSFKVMENSYDKLAGEHVVVLMEVP
jgi:hypothetical protein